MISLRTVKKYCKHYTQIENYNEALKDDTQTWICHHILGEILTSEQLKIHNFYYDVPPCMLKFVTKSEHSKIHKPRKGKKIPFKRRKLSEKPRKKMSEETRKKISESCKGRKFSAETRKKISEANKKRKVSAETRKKLSEALKGRVPWNKKSKV